MKGPSALPSLAATCLCLFVVVVDREGEEAWIVDPLLLQLAEDMAVGFQRAVFIVHFVEKGYTQKVVQRQQCSYLVVKAASSFIYSPTDD